MFEKLDIEKPFCLEKFVKKWIDIYVELYGESNRALMQVRMMILNDGTINKYFSEFENNYLKKITDILIKNGIKSENLSEKVYLSCILIDSLRQEKSAFSHEGLNYNILKQQSASMIIKILSE